MEKVTGLSIKPKTWVSAFGGRSEERRVVAFGGRALKRSGAGNGTHPYQTTNTGGVIMAVRTAGLSSSLKRETAQTIV